MDKKTITCDKCDYRWETKSEMYLVSCPRCASKVKIKKESGDNESRNNREISE